MRRITDTRMMRENNFLNPSLLLVFGLAIFFLVLYSLGSGLHRVLKKDHDHPREHRHVKDKSKGLHGAVTGAIADTIVL